MVSSLFFVELFEMKIAKKITNEIWFYFKFLALHGASIKYLNNFYIGFVKN